MSGLLSVAGISRNFDVSAPLLRRLATGTGRQILRAVQDVSLDVPKGSVFGLVGESGCGKSTLARMIVGLERTDEGAISYDGVDLSGAGRQSVRGRLQMIFQDPYASLNPRWRVRDVVAEPLRVRRLLESEAAVAARVRELLLLVGLAAEDGAKYPHQFSGGQRQRISIARALAGEPEFLVCDEPTSALDVSMQAQVLNLMKRLQRQFGLTYLFISHNLAVVYHVSDRVGVMYLGRLVESGPTREVFRGPRHPYTRMLLDSLPDMRRLGRQRQPLSGEVPSPLNPPPGCAFHPRCPFARDICRSQLPAPLLAGERMVACHGVREGWIATEGAAAIVP